MDARGRTGAEVLGGWIPGLCVLLASVTPLHSSTITLSDYASNGDPPEVVAEDLDATLEFGLDSTWLPDNPTLTVTLTNQTTSPALFNMNEIYFNVPTNITGMTLLTQTTYWTLYFDNGTPGQEFQVDGFGIFDVALKDGLDGSPGVVLPGESKSFDIELTGTGTVSDTDFVSLFSAPVDGDMLMIVAAKFIDGPGGSSGYGATPEPSTLVILAVGSVALLRGRRRTKGGGEAI